MAMLGTFFSMSSADLQCRLFCPSSMPCSKWNPVLYDCSRRRRRYDDDHLDPVLCESRGRIRRGGNGGVHVVKMKPVMSLSTKDELAPLGRARPVSSPEVQKVLDSIKWDKNGLAVAIAQHINTGAILMQGFANSDAVSATLASGRATFYSRSRSSLWTKGETSSNFINVKDVFMDCDHDSIIYLGLPDGPSCHTGAETCYFTSVFTDLNEDDQSNPQQALTTLYSLERTINKRRNDLLASTTDVKPSWTQKLLKNPSLLCSKIREEADELCRTVEENEGKVRTASEMADVLYHSMVLLSVQDVKFEEVLEVLRARFSKSGIEEKNSRK